MYRNYFYGEDFYLNVTILQYEKIGQYQTDRRNAGKNNTSVSNDCGDRINAIMSCQDQMEYFAIFQKLQRFQTDNRHFKSACILKMLTLRGNSNLSNAHIKCELKIYAQ